ncbi:MAG: bifunctional serine/threonine-protein kinase/formylglycine-generating enzyme family protein [Planctomycetota bacterium]
MASDTSLSPAEALFASFLSNLESDPEADFEAFCREHPDHAEALRELKSAWDRAAAFKDKLGLAVGQSSAGESDAGSRSDERRRKAAELYADVIERLTARGLPFERFEVDGELARGGMGTILRVQDQDLRRTLAMKVLTRLPVRDETAADSDPSTFVRFLDEAQVTAQLDHPGIVPVHDLGLDRDGRLYFTMKLVKGKTLREVIDHVHAGEGEWSQTRVLGILLQVCQAMAYAHDKDVIHRDLKPSNVMIGRYGEVYVMDWGVARVLGREDERDLRIQDPESRTITFVRSARQEQGDDSDSPLLTMDGEVVGTPAYMSPEQAGGRVDEMGPASDVYSVGAMLYHLLTGHMPYVPDGKRMGPHAVLHSVQQDPPRALHLEAPGAPAEIVAICEKAMARSAAERYTTMSALADDIRAFLEHRVVGAYETGAFAELRKWVLRNRMTASAVAAALVAIFGGLYWSRSAEIHAAEEIELTHDFYRLNYLLQEEADELWPATPAKADAMRGWIDKAEEFLAKRGEHERRLRTLEREGGSAADVDTRSRVLALLNRLEGTAASPGRLDEMRRREALARSLAEQTVTGADAARRWEAAITSIADKRECPLYGGLQIRPQLGLLPLARNPASGLWEFAHIPSGAPPVRNADGDLIVDQGTGVVLVLVPGGEALVGTDPEREARNSRGGVIHTKKEGPQHTCPLDPFFLSKYELTQGQWERIEGVNPAFFQTGNDFGKADYDRTHPVESVDWEDCELVLARMGLDLPTEVQWEYAARAGTSGPWWTGEDFRAIDGAANVIDAHAKRVDGPTGWFYEEWMDDGYTTTAPVGTYRANDFGLHDTMGNVWEWTRDFFTIYDIAPRAGDGLRGTTPSSTHVARGGAFYNSVSAVRSAYRLEIPGFRIAYGVRPARPLARAGRDE